MRSIYRVTYKLFTEHRIGSWSEEDLPYPSDGGPNGWVLSELKVAPHPSGAILVIACWCRVDPWEATP